MRGRKALAFAALAGCVAVPFFPWIRTGEATRNSYEALRSAQRLGLDQLTPFRVVWFLVPVVAVAAAMAVAAKLTRTGGVLTLVVGTVVAAAGTSVLLVDVSAALGLYLAIAVGLLAAALGLLLVFGTQEDVEI